jgi:hypothetical protein
MNFKNKSPPGHLTVPHCVQNLLCGYLMPDSPKNASLEKEAVRDLDVMLAAPPGNLNLVGPFF